MKIIMFLSMFIFLSSSVLIAQPLFRNQPNAGFSGEDIGNPLLNGKMTYSKEKQLFTIDGAGYNMWNERDEFYFASQEMDGDFILSANLKFLGDGVVGHRKMGLMIRSSKEDNSVCVYGTVHGDGTSALQYRQEAGGESVGEYTELRSPDFIQIERKGTHIFFRLSREGSPLLEHGSVEIELSDKVYTGMFVCSHRDTIMESAEFWNVRLDRPAAEGVDGYKSPSPSRLETIEMESGFRKVIYETEKHIEAPNWSRDGKYLIYNSEGKLYKFKLNNSKISVINTDFANDNNNDHGISFDGKMLAISSQTEQADGSKSSAIYTVSIKGGIPKAITKDVPSYWHGWSPDGNDLVFTARRNSDFNIYKIPAEGGKEIQLTDSPGVDDGPEYSPDGKYIYFNSVRSGKMKIWRMNPDGSNPEQVTFDNYQDWFAHPSPDGKWLVFVSYKPEDVLAGSHPRNQRVMLRLMPVGGGEIKTLAFIYGGQGTINVPSWSPDSKKVAFVSYTY